MTFYSKLYDLVRINQQAFYHFIQKRDKNWLLAKSELSFRIFQGLVFILTNSDELAFEKPNQKSTRTHIPIYSFTHLLE